jgi:hypothetical protein
MIITHDVHQAISLTETPGALPLWSFQYGNTPKPHFRSLRTPAGHELALVEPYDHLWHRGLWFAIKFVNGENFWEEREPFGIQQVHGIPQVTIDDAAVSIDMQLDWVGPGGNSPIAETRRITWHPGDGAYILDWTSNITANVDLTLDRTPYTTWGGYSGLSFRGTRTWHIQRYMLPSREEAPLTAGYRAPWCDLSGKFDGGANLAGGIAMFDIPGETGESTPWYGGGNPAMNFFNAAFLFEGPMDVPKGQTLDFTYRVIVHDGIWIGDQAETAYREWLDGRDEATDTAP